MCSLYTLVVLHVYEIEVRRFFVLFIFKVIAKKVRDSTGKSFLSCSGDLMMIKFYGKQAEMEKIDFYFLA
jgi:hypothetical protein